MSKQYDYQSGFDPSSLTQITALQLLQLVNEITPLANIGGVIEQNTEPDIVNNPRFTRYIWFDTSVDPKIPKRYSATTLVSGSHWIAVTVSANSVVEESVANGSITPIKLAGNSNLANAYYILRQNSDSTEIELVDLLTAIGAAAGIGSSILDWLAGKTSGGGAAIGGSSAQKVFSWDGTDLTLVDPAFTLASLAAGAAAANQVPAYVGGQWTPKDVISLIANDSLAIAKIVKGIDNQYLGVTGGAIAWRNGVLTIRSGAKDGASLSAAAGNIDILHEMVGLTAAPDIVDVRLVVGTATTAGYEVGDEVDVKSLVVISTNTPDDSATDRARPFLNVSSNTTTVTVTKTAKVSTTVMVCIPHKTTGVLTNVTASLANFTPRIRCYALV